MAHAEDQQLVEKIEDFYQTYYREQINELAQNYPDERSLFVDWDDLFDYDPDIANDYLANPHQARNYAEEALRLYDLPVDVALSQARVRVYNLPNDTAISDIRSRHLNTLVSVYGTVTTASDVIASPKEVAWECQRCGTLTRIPADDRATELSDTPDPHECHGCERQGPFIANLGQSELEDAQTIVVREPLEGATTDDTRSSIIVDLDADLADLVGVGDHVTVTGEIELSTDDRGHPGALTDKTLTAHAITETRANDHYTLTDKEKREIVERSGDDEIYEQLVASLAPSVYGHEVEKLALVLQLFAGVRKELPDGETARGDIHVGLIGDPSSAASALAQQAAALAPRAALVDGSDTTQAGLTSAATVSSASTGVSPWTIEGGALAMANKGLAVIDNFDHLKVDAQQALQGVLKHQEIRASKATEKRSIPAETSVLVAGHPKYDRFDEYEPIGEQLDFAPQTLGQFDLLFTLPDKPDPNRDAEVAEHIIQTHYAGELATQAAELEAANVSDEEVDQAQASMAPTVDHELLRKYIVYARRNCYPTFTEPAKEQLRDYYVSSREMGVGEDQPVPITVRKLEAAVRLAEASARVRLSDVVEEEDVQRVINVIEVSLHSVGVRTGPEEVGEESDVTPVDDDREFRKNVKTIIANIQEDYEEGAPLEEVLERATEALSVRPEQVEKAVETLKQYGELYEPATDHLRTT